MISGLNLLIVEDEQPLLESVIVMANRLGHRTLRARDAEEAVIVLNAWHRHIQVVLLDWSLTMNMAGGQLVESIHEIDPTISVIVMSSFPEESVRRVIPERLQFSFLRKPFLNYELEMAIQNAKLRR